MIELIKKIKKVTTDEKNERGENVVKTYTNLIVRISIGDNVVDVPIQPVNFGEKTNRKGYSILSSAAKLEEEKLF